MPESQECPFDPDNPNSVNEYLESLYPRVLARVRNRMGDALRSREESMDVVQRAIGVFWCYIPRLEFRGRAQLETLINLMVENTIRGRAAYWAKACKEVAHNRGLNAETSVVWGEPPADGPTPSAVVAGQEDVARLYVATRLLNPLDQQILFLRQHKVSYADIGSAASLKPDAARMRYKRALVRLAKVMDHLEKRQLDDALRAAEPDGHDGCSDCA